MFSLTHQAQKVCWDCHGLGVRDQPTPDVFGHLGRRCFWQPYKYNLDGQGDKRDNLDEEFGSVIIGFHFFASLLHETGWPRKQGLFRRLVVDTTIVDLIIDQMITWWPPGDPQRYCEAPSYLLIHS